MTVILFPRANSPGGRGITCLEALSCLRYMYSIENSTWLEEGSSVM